MSRQKQRRPGGLGWSSSGLGQHRMKPTNREQSEQWAESEKWDGREPGLGGPGFGAQLPEGCLEAGRDLYDSKGWALDLNQSNPSLYRRN